MSRHAKTCRNHGQVFLSVFPVYYSFEPGRPYSLYNRFLVFSSTIWSNSFNLPPLFRQTTSDASKVSPFSMPCSIPCFIPFSIPFSNPCCIASCIIVRPNPVIWSTSFNTNSFWWISTYSEIFPYRTEKHLINNQKPVLLFLVHDVSQWHSLYHESEIHDHHSSFTEILWTIRDGYPLYRKCRFTDAVPEYHRMICSKVRTLLKPFYHKRLLRTDWRAFPASDTFLIVYNGRFKIFLAQSADRTGFHRRTFMILRTVLFSDFQLSFHNDSSFPRSK